MQDNRIAEDRAASTERSLDERLRRWQERWRDPEKRMMKTVYEYAMKRLE